MRTFLWILATVAVVILVLSLILAVQGSVGSWFTAVGMLCLLISVAAIARQERKRQK